MTKAELLKNWQSQLGINNREAAEALCTPLRTYMDWRAGDRSPPHCLPLAMAAVSAGLDPVRPDESDDEADAE